MSKAKGSPAGLVSIAWAGKQSGDRNLVRTAKFLLRTKYGIRISFSSPSIKAGVR
jgi:hypothetical protein